MDPTTTLITFMLQTHPSVQSVHLVGSWDNFSRYYIMERDIRRDRGQWKGCYSFKDIVCDDDFGSRQKRNGGLKMGHTYYYYYELDGSYETHDPTLPATNACPYLPGQTVNTLFVPVERVLRKRSASLSSMRGRDYRTMNPHDKYVTPRAAPAIPESPTGGQPLPRVGSSPLIISNRDSASRSQSPTAVAAPPTWKRLLGLRSSHGSRGSEDRGRQFDLESSRSESAASHHDDERSVVSSASDGTRTRDISPESLRRFLSDDMLPPFSPPPPPPTEEKSLAVLIPEDIAEEVEEEADDDENFATSATAEHLPYATCLSPPPFKRTHSSQSNASSLLLSAASPATNNDSSMTLTAKINAADDEVAEQQEDEAVIATTSSVAPILPPMDFSIPRSRFSVSTIGSLDDEDLASPQSPSDELPSFYDSNDDDDVLSSNDGDAFSFQPLSLPSTRKQSIDLQSQDPRQTAFAGYSLPQAGVADGLMMAKNLEVPAAYGASLGSPALIARNDAGMPVGNTTSLLAAPADSGLDDLVSELGWMVDVIRGKGV